MRTWALRHLKSNGLDEDQSEHCLDLEHDRQFEQDDPHIAHELQIIFDAEDIIPKGENSSITDSRSAVASLSRDVDHSSQLFIVVRRGAPTSLNRVLSIWS